MDEETLNTTIRRFLKEFGVSSHQAVDAAVRAAVAEGRVREGEAVEVSATLTVDAIGLSQTVDGVLSTKLD
jgi:hypothetical protein